MEKSEKELATVEAIEPEIIIDRETGEALQRLAESRAAWVDSIIQRSLSRLRPADVVNMSGRPWITADGLYKIARVFGLSISYHGLPQRFDAEDKKGKYYFYVVHATVSIKNGIDSVEVIGNCSSRDSFFAKADGEWRPLEEVDALDLMQKAVTNADSKGIAKLLGLRNITWEELVKWAKIGTDDVASFSFKKTAKVSKGSAERREVRSEVPPQSSGADKPKAERPSEASATPTAPDAAPEAPKSEATKQTEKPPEQKSLRAQALEAIKSYCEVTGKPLMDSVKKFAGKTSLGLCSDDECKAIIMKVAEAKE